MSSATSIMPIEIEKQEQRGKYTVGIIGCGRIGVLHACLFADAGFHVICADTNQAIVDNISKSKVPYLKNEIDPIIRKHVNDGSLKATNDLKAAVAQSEIVFVAVPVSVDEKGRTDYSNLERVLKQVGSSLRRGTLVIIASTVRIGATEGLLKEVLEGVSGLKAGTDFLLAYSPVLFPERQTLKTLSDYRRIVAAGDKNSLEIASAILGVVSKAGVVKAYNLKTAEATALFEAVYEYAKTALANEFALFCEKIGVDYFAVQNLAKTNPKSGIASPTLAHEKNDEALHILLDSAENLDLKLKISKAAKETNAETLKNAANLIREALKTCGKTLRRAKLSILGVSQTPNVMDIPKSSLKTLGEILEAKGAKINLYDPYLPSKTSIELKQASIKKSLTEAVEGADCIVIFTGHDQFKRLNLKKLKLMAKMPAAIVDFEGVIDPVKAEAEGFIYRGLGRGVWMK